MLFPKGLNKEEPIDEEASSIAWERGNHLVHELHQNLTRQIQEARLHGNRLLNALETSVHVLRVEIIIEIFYFLLKQTNKNIYIYTHIEKKKHN